MRAFNFEIKSVDTAHGVMNVEYTTEGHDPVEVGVRLPMQDEDEDALIESAAPEAVWAMREFMASPKAIPTVGRKGRIERVEAVLHTPVEAPQPTAEITVKRRAVL